MTLRRSDHQYRKDTVLGIVVNEYIRSVTPISSGHIAQGYPLDLSPASIRHILSELEQDGFLTHPHTSAGRIPTQDGYRYYVDHLMHEIQLLEDEKQRIDAEYQKEVRDLEFIMEKTSRVLSDVTHYTSIVSVEGFGDRLFCRGTSFIVEYADSQDLGKIRDILKALEEKERILALINRNLEHKINIYIGHEMALAGIETCSLAVSAFRGRQGYRGRMAILGPTRMDYQRVVSALDYCTQLMNHML
jgi:transcriptional regulator of heat shock response